MRFFVVVVFVSELDVKLGALFGIRENDPSATGKQSDGALENRPPIMTWRRVGAMAPGVGFHSRTRDAPVSPPQVFPTEPNRGSSFPGSRTRTMSSVAQGAVVAATRACFTESRRPQSRRAQSAPRSGRVAGRRAGSVTVRLVRASAADADATELATELAGERSAPRPLEPLVYHFEGDSATIVSARTGQLVRRGFSVTDAARFGGAVNNNAVSVFSLKARDGSPRGTVPGTTFPGTTVPGTVPRDVADVSSSATSAPAGAFAEATAFAAETYAFKEDGSAVVFAADGTRLRRHQAQATGWAVAKVANAETETASAEEEEAAAATEKKDSLPARVVTKNVTGNVFGGKTSLRRGVENAVHFVVNGVPGKPVTPQPVVESAQAWIDAWAAGAPKAELNAIKASREEGEEEDEREEEEEEKEEPEVTTKAPPSFDLGDMDLAGATPGGASRINADPTERDFPDSVFVSDDEADQDAMEDALAPKKPTTEAKTTTTTKTRRAAFFDVDGTVARSNVVSQYVAWKMSTLNFVQKLCWVPFYAVKCALYLLVDKVSRSAFNAMFAKDFKGARASEAAKREMARVSFEAYLRARVFPAALEAIAVLKAQGFEIVLVTGSLDFMIEPVAALVGADAVVANELETARKTSTEDGETNEEEWFFTGALRGVAVADDEKRVRVLAYAEANGIDLGASRAYGDALADEAMLRAVGTPSVVSPKRAMRARAEREGWPILEWA